ncbi:MAG: hypothetical protein WA064_01515 [Candidatus Moraniibacteriota bacterium]
MSEPKEKNTKEWYAWALRHHYHYNPIFLTCAVRNGLNLALIRSYLRCLEKRIEDKNFSALLMKNYHFNTIHIWNAYKNSFDAIDMLLKYIDCLETEIYGKQKSVAINTKSCIALFVLVSMLIITSPDAMACCHPPRMLAYHKKTVCYGFVPHIFKERKDGRWRYYIKEILSELPCPRR